MIGVAVNPVALVVALVVFGSGIGLALWQGVVLAIPATLVAAGVLRFGLYLAAKHREIVVDTLKAKVDEARSGYAEAPHVIAHSFGTYVVGDLLKRFPDQGFSRVILTGSILPRKWGFLNHGAAFSELRNEQGQKDHVVRLAGWAGWVVPDIGNSGAKGLLGSGSIHTILHPMRNCDSCLAEGSARVHNVLLEHFAHRQHFLSPYHAYKLWLPFLWGFSPREYDEFLGGCARVAQLNKDGPDHELREEERRLLSRQWDLLRGESLSRHLAKRAAAKLARLGLTASAIGNYRQYKRKIVDDACLFTYLLVGEAIAEQAKRDRADANLVLALHPLVAAGRGLEKAIMEAR